MKNKKRAWMLINHPSLAERNTNMHFRTLWITRTAVLIALLVVLQAATIPLGNNFITGSVVNLMLIISVMTCGLATGATVAVISPAMPTLLGFGPTWPLIPFIAAGNIVLVLLWHFVGNRQMKYPYAAYIAALIAAAVAKFLVLYFGVVRIAIPFILGLPEQSVLSYLFSFPQLITASIGGVCAIILLPTLKKAINRDKPANIS